MSIRRTPRMTVDTAERLLAGADGGIDDRYRRLAAVLAAAAGPARPAELAGRHEAVAGFRTAQLHPVLPQRRRSVFKTAVIKLLTVKAAAIAAVAVGAGGVALAATTGALPNPLSHANPASSAAASHASARPSSSSGHNPSNASPSPSLVGLCHAFTAGAGSEHGKALENPAFGALITAAGGKDKVEAYCTKLLAASPSESAHPGGKPSDHPTGGPASHPAANQSGQPTARPSH